MKNWLLLIILMGIVGTCFGQTQNEDEVPLEYIANKVPLTIEDSFPINEIYLLPPRLKQVNCDTQFYYKVQYTCSIDYIQQQIQEQLKENNFNCTERFYLRFVITKTGSTENIEIARTIDSCKACALKAIEAFEHLRANLEWHPMIWGGRISRYRVSFGIDPKVK